MTLLTMVVAVYVVGAVLSLVLCTVLSDWSARDVALFAVIWPVVLAVIVVTVAVGLCEAVGRFLQRGRA